MTCAHVHTCEHTYTHTHTTNRWMSREHLGEWQLPLLLVAGKLGAWCDSLCVVVCVALCAIECIAVRLRMYPRCKREWMLGANLSCNLSVRLCACICTCMHLRECAQRIDGVACVGVASCVCCDVRCSMCCSVWCSM